MPKKENVGIILVGDDAYESLTDEEKKEFFLVEKYTGKDIEFKIAYLLRHWITRFGNPNRVGREYNKTRFPFKGDEAVDALGFSKNSLMEFVGVEKIEDLETSIYMKWMKHMTGEEKKEFEKINGGKNVKVYRNLYGDDNYYTEVKAKPKISLICADDFYDELPEDEKKKWHWCGRYNQEDMMEEMYQINVEDMAYWSDDIFDDYEEILPLTGESELEEIFASVYVKNIHATWEERYRWKHEVEKVLVKDEWKTSRLGLST